VRLHRVAQQVAIGTLHGAHLGRIGIGAGAEVVEAGAHVQRLARAALVVAAQHGQVDGAAAAVAGHRGYVVAEQFALVQRRIVRGLGALVVRVVRPAHEMRDRPRRAIAIVDAQAQVALAQVGIHPCQGLGGIALEPAAWRLVAIHRRADEVVAAPVGDLLGQVRHQAADVHHPGLLHRGRGGHTRRSLGPRRRRRQAQDQSQHRQERAECRSGDACTGNPRQAGGRDGVHGTSSWGCGQPD